jgi:hypothetical protein
MEKNAKSTSPSEREMMEAELSIRISLAIRKSTTAASKLKGISTLTVWLLTFIGLIMADTPRISRIFIELLPRTFPKAKPLFPLNEASRFTTSSGVDVPNATTVNPTVNADTPRRVAMEEAPSTNQWAPAIRTTNPITKIMISRYIVGCMEVVLLLITACKNTKTQGKNDSLELKDHNNDTILLLVLVVKVFC